MKKNGREEEGRKASADFADGRRFQVRMCAVVLAIPAGRYLDCNLRPSAKSADDLSRHVSHYRKLRGPKC